MASTAMKIAYLSPHAAETRRMASKKANPTVVGLTWVDRKKPAVIAETTAAEMMKRTI